MNAPALRAAQPADLGAIRALLASAGLPCDDVDAAMLRHFLVADDVSGLTGCVGLEVAGDAALLRSLAVAPAVRGSGLGARLLKAAESAARALGLRELCLLTTSAAGYFTARGYAPITRAQAPTALLSTAQFASLCPASSACLHKILSP